MGGQRREKENRRRMILTRNNPFGFDGDLKTNGNEVRERNGWIKFKNFFEKT